MQLMWGAQHLGSSKQRRWAVLYGGATRSRFGHDVSSFRRRSCICRTTASQPLGTRLESLKDLRSGELRCW